MAGIFPVSASLPSSASRPVSYTYDSLNRIATSTSVMGTITRTYSLGISPPAAETYHFGYDQAERLTSGVLKNTATGAVLADHQFLYDPADNQLSIRENTRLKSGTFNNANQLTAEAGGGKVRITGSVNKAGASVTVAGQPAAVHPQGGFAVEVQAAPGANHFPLVVTEADGTVTTKYVDLFVENSIPVIYSYDANGNLESVAPQATPGSPSRTYQWDAANRLVGITRIISPTETRKTELLYNGEGARVGKKELLNGVVESDIRYFYGGTGVLQERSADGGTVTKTYTPQGELDYSTNPPTPRYLTRDHLGSVREVVAEDGSLLARYDYKPYGERVLISGTYETAKGYTGHDYLPETGMILTRYRAYDPMTGRWLSSDPIGEEGGMNLYGYVEGDPINAVDPQGLDLILLSKNVSGDEASDYIFSSQLVNQRNIGGNNTFDAHGHGNRAGVYDDRLAIPAVLPGAVRSVMHANAKNRNFLSAEQLADLIQKNGWKPSQQIKLYICNSGASPPPGEENLASLIAQILANRTSMAVEVSAPNAGVRLERNLEVSFGKVTDSGPQRKAAFYTTRKLPKK